MRRHQDQSPHLNPFKKKSPHLAERHQSVRAADDLWMREIDPKKTKKNDGERIEGLTEIT